ncbi:CobW family GTP-binding protein [Peribacillus acanthi]|uniref:CobW family GTP-binding protein n=1 Tax=Peribacillus acanthi TaxID=2171554 RepID=UPI000D3E866E|nr:GTP-binding protein [Peribacillus acanthi]
MKLTEIYILGGFLGSGKTTLLQKIVNEEKNSGRKIAILLNELGKVSVDSKAFDEQVPLKEMFDGCICCTIQDKLEAQIQDLLTHDLDAIYIETTGAAHPVEVLDAIISPLFATRLLYKGIITVVDMLRWRDRASFSPQIRHLMLEQIQHADLLILNKIDLVSEMEAGQISFEIQQINSHAKLIITEHSRVGLNAIHGVTLGEKNYSGNSGKKDLQLQTIVYTFKGAISREKFEDWLRSLPESVYRMKGYIPFSHSQYPHLFQYSYGMPMSLPEDMNMPLNLVIIGESLDKKLITEQLEELQTTH